MDSRQISFGNLFLIGLTLFLTTVSIYPCSFGTKLPLESDPDEFVFIGTVIGYTQPIEFPHRLNTTPQASPQEGDWYEARGLKLKLSEPVSIRQEPKEFFEVYPYHYSGVCSPLGVTERWLNNNFSVGSKVFVVGQLSKDLPFEVSAGNLRLEIKPGLGGLGRIHIGEYESTSSSAFNYDMEKHFSLDLLQFEIRKDLIRLEQTQNDQKRIEIINRMSNLIVWAKGYDLYSIYRRFIDDKTLVDELYTKNLELQGHDKKFIKRRLECVKGKANAPRERKSDFPC